MIKKPVKPTPYYIKYNTHKINDTEYKIEITYFIYRGNVISDIDKRLTKILVCPIDKFKEKEIVLHNRVVKTYNLLTIELRRIGANQTAANSVISEKMR